MKMNGQPNLREPPQLLWRHLWGSRPVAHVDLHDFRAVPAAGGEPETSQREDDPDPGDHDTELVAAARRIVADTRHAGTRLSQIALAEKLRSEGHKVANNRLRWLAAVSGLEAGQDGEPATRASGGQ